jgi:hypothetical protein
MFASVFHLDVAYVCNGFKCFLGVFTSVSDTCFKCFIYLLLYVATVASGCFRSELSVTHGIRVGSGWRHGPRPARREPIAGALARSMYGHCQHKRTG